MQKKHINQIIQGDCRETLRSLPDNSVHCVVTSIPYFALRDYGVSGQIGLEETPEQYLEEIVEVFVEVKRVLRNDGTLWLNIGDSYWGGKGKSGQSYSAKYQNERFNGGRSLNPSHTQLGGANQTRATDRRHHSIKPKDLVGIPWMLAFALRDAGWYLRQDIIWHKPNPMPESIKDRCTKAHEYIFLLTKSPKYYFDAEAISTEVLDPSDYLRRMGQTYAHPSNWDSGTGSHGSFHKNGREPNKKTSSGNLERKPRPGTPEGTGKNQKGSVPWEGQKANKRSVWTIPTIPFKEAHFATFPENLIVDCIKAGCPQGGVVLDPFMGAGTTALVAQKLQRNYIGLELNPDYIQIAEQRLKKELGFMYQHEYLPHE